MLRVLLSLSNIDKAQDYSLGPLVVAERPIIRDSGVLAELFLGDPSSHNEVSLSEYFGLVGAHEGAVAAAARLLVDLELLLLDVVADPGVVLARRRQALLVGSYYRRQVADTAVLARVAV